MHTLSNAFAALAMGKYKKQLNGVPVEAKLPLAIVALRAGKAIALPSNEFVHAARNLHSHQFRTVLSAFSYGSAQYDTRFNWPDAILVMGRIEIAHGRATAPTLNDFLDSVNPVLDVLPTDVVDAFDK